MTQDRDFDDVKEQMSGFQSIGLAEEKYRRQLVFFKRHNSSKRVKAKESGLSFSSTRSRGRRARVRCVDLGFPFRLTPMSFALRVTNLP